MRKNFNWVNQSIEINADNLKEERDLDLAVKSGILEKKCFGIWELKA